MKKFWFLCVLLALTLSAILTVACTLNSSGSSGAGGGNGSSALKFWADSRLKPSNTKPLFIASLYRERFAAATGNTFSRYNDDTFEVTNPVYWEADMTPDVLWDLIPATLKPYTVMEFHFNDEGAGASKNDAKGFYNKLLSWCDANEIPATIVVLAAGTGGTHAFNSINPTDPTDKAWAEQMCQNHPSLKGFISTEHWWNGGTSQNVSDRSADWIEFCANNDKTFIIHDGGPSTVDYAGRGTKFKNAMERYGKDYLIHSFKSTGRCFTTHINSYLVAHWMAEYSQAYGGLIDTWSWNNHGLGPAMQTAGGGRNKFGDGGYANIAQYAGGYLASELMAMYMNGGTVFNFEAPWHVYGNSGKASELLTEVIAPFFEWIAKHPAPTAAEMRSMQKYYVYGDNNTASSAYDTLGAVGWAQFGGYAGGKENYNAGGTKNNGIRLIKTDRYNIIPYFYSADFGSANDALTRIKSLPGGENTVNVVNSVTKDDWESAYGALTVSATKEVGKVEAFAGKRKISGKNTWFFYNWEMSSDANYDATGRQVARVELENGKELEISLTPYTSVIVEQDSNNSLRVFLNNYCLDTSGLWKALSSRQIRNDEYAENLCVGGSKTNANKDRYVRDTRFYFDGYNNVSANIIKSQDYPVASVSTSTDGNSKLVTVRSNGWVEFAVNLN